MGNEIKSKWDFLLQCRPDIRGMIGNTKLIGGHISHNSNHQKIFNFITKAHSLIMKGQMNLKGNCRFVRTDRSNDQKRGING
jgi:hypothetical protein